MRDIKSIKLLYFKGFLFLFGCAAASAALFVDSPSIKTAVLICIAVWFSARFYYFLFYVIENYIDKDFKYIGLYSFIKYIAQKKSRDKTS